MSNLESHREAIDGVDRQILTLLNQRAAHAEAIGKIKAQNGAAFYVPEREEALLANLRESNAGPLPDSSVKAIFREVLSACRALEKRLSVVHCGSGSFLAARNHFGSCVQYLPIESATDAVAWVREGRADYAVVPLETEQLCPVWPSLEALAGSGVHLCAQIDAYALRGRFGVAGTQATQPSGCDRCAVLLTPPDEPGSLIQVLEPFSRASVNLRQVSLRRGSPGLVFAEIEAHASELEEPLGALESAQIPVHVLGSYASPQ